MTRMFVISRADIRDLASRGVGSIVFMATTDGEHAVIHSYSLDMRKGETAPANFVGAITGLSIFVSHGVYIDATPHPICFFEIKSIIREETLENAQRFYDRLTKSANRGP